MQLHFYKYQGTGNDFILLDNRTKVIELNKEQIALLCDRRFGIGADGLMLLENANGFDFRMVYYNSDGGESTMCGNGGRCITAFAKRLGLVTTHASFMAIDGGHTATIKADGNISLHMNDVDKIKHHDSYTVLNTGSPHYVTYTENVEAVDVFHTGRNIRNQDEYQPAGINVNFVQRIENGLWVRTYERGVEDETLSCGTGVTAAAIASTTDAVGTFDIPIKTPGGNLQVSFTKDNANSAKDVVLHGPAAFVFEGKFEIA